MPRDGSGIYVLPFPDVVSDTSIESPVYNGFTNDVAQDLNSPRPIVSGGTGATSTTGARAAMGAEVASAVVVNYDSHIFEAGSFYSAAGATGAPTTNAFSGICYKTDANNIVIEARDAVTGVKYARTKIAGMWGSFFADGMTNFVELTGDTMTGNLSIVKDDPTIVLDDIGLAAIGGSLIVGKKDGKNRWLLRPGNGAPETGSNIGSDFEVSRYDDAGVYIDTPINISRSTGLGTIKGDPSAALGIATKQYVDTQVATQTSPAELSTAVSDAITAEVARANAAYQTKDAQLFAGIPINGPAPGYTTVLTDAQKCINGTGARTINNALAYPLGTVITFTAYGGSATVALSSGVLYFNQGGTILIGTRTLSTTGAVATAIKVTSTDWIISGNGLS